ncbi:winged helix-turn-helix transcriptional regulator [Blautia faecis]|uniref:winged helix-turn-helix domain-containing protein n=1 Tax=Blautia faecis TaxID=871665 RepID=UPI00165564D1|nr:winged helix-turn-helix domain-containing protein [Blautia faecis]MBC8615432.1 winged helix-turn-helix transcriptional regulator [Blautia faecis]
MVLTVLENEERIFEWIEQYLIVNKEFTITNSEQNILLTFPGLEIDIQNREIWIESGKVILTDLEFRILLFLAKRPEQIFSYQQIYEGVWNESYTGNHV